MDRFNKLGRGLQLMLVGSVLLLIDTFFNWQGSSGEVFGQKYSVGWSAWHGFWGVVMGLLTIVLIAWLVARLAAVDIPMPVSLTGAVLAFLILACAVIKNLSDDYSTFWSYLGIALAAVIAVGAWMQIQEAGGVENLKSEIPSMPSSGGTAAASAPPAAAAEAPPAPAAAEPPAAAPEAESAAEEAADEPPKEAGT
jgi:hypothetical protein